MATQGERSAHWLEKAVRRREPARCASKLALDPRMPARQAWAEATDVCGLTPARVAECVADEYRLEVADFDAAEPTATKFVPAELARKHLVFPLREDYRELVVATCDPMDPDVEQELAFASGRSVRFAVAPPLALEHRVNQTFAPDRILETLVSGVELPAGDSIDIVTREQDLERPTIQELDASPVIKLTSLILRDAIAKGASDVHLQPFGGEGVVRFRVDGVLQSYMKLPGVALTRVVSRIKVLGDMDIADHIRPQDGRARIMWRGKKFDLRISTVPTGGAEKAVIRVLDTEGAPSLESIGFPEVELARLRTLLGRREGIILVTGPTGSGKTTTLYASLRELSREGVNIMTVEDPVEYELQGIAQIQANPKQGVTFASALRAILRQDPDIILVGEIRDLETAEMAIQAAMTGHLVLATLHTNEASGSVRRLLDLGLQAPAIADAVRGAIAQRLVREVCSECGEEVVEEDLDEEERELTARYEVAPKIRAVGCERCDHMGYQGRLPVAEVMIVDGEVQDETARGASTAEIRRAAEREGMRPMLQSARELVTQRRTTLEEVHRVLGEGSEDAAASGDAGGASLQGDGSAAAAEPGTGEKEVDPVEGATAKGPEVGRDAGSVRGDPAPGRALVVDDDATTRTVVRGLLTKLGLEVREVGDGTEAVRVLKSDPVWDVVVLDLDMPLLDGRDVLRVLRSYVPTTTLPVLVLTGTPDPDAEMEVLELGADDYVRKPIEAARLLGRVKALLRRTAVYAGKT